MSGTRNPAGNAIFAVVSYVVTATPPVFIQLRKALSLSGPYIATGSKVLILRISLHQFVKTLAGQTTKKCDAPAFLSATIAASASTVFPRPISSPSKTLPWCRMYFTPHS